MGYYEQVRDDYYRQQAEKSQNRYGNMSNSDLPDALAKANANMNFYDGREETDEDVRILAGLMRHCAGQDVEIIQNTLTDRVDQLNEQYESATKRQAYAAEQLSRLRQRLFS